MRLKRYYKVVLAACVAGWCSAGPTEAGYIPDVPYFHQQSNRINPSGSCQNTCIAIVLKYYGADDITPDMISAKWGTYVAQSTGGLEKVFNEEAALRGLSVRDQATETGLLRELHALLDAGRPVIVHGGFSTVGQQVAVLAEGTYPADSYILRWGGVSDRGCALAAGLYSYRLQTSWGVQTRKLLLLK
jgi:hypothetical protein